LGYEGISKLLKEFRQHPIPTVVAVLLTILVFVGSHALDAFLTAYFTETGKQRAALHIKSLAPSRVSSLSYGWLSSIVPSS
jgi:hypothetical protein